MGPARAAHLVFGEDVALSVLDSLTIAALT